MKYFPIFIDMEGQSAVVVGGGEPALQKVRLLLKTPVRITVIAETPAPELQGDAAAGRITLHARAWVPADLDGAFIVYGATGDKAQNGPIAAAARARGILVNVVDEPGPSTFITPAIVDRDPMVVAIGSEGTSPVLAREIKTHLEAHLPASFGRIARAAASLRERIAQAVPDLPTRRRFWVRLLTGPFRDAALLGDDSAAEAAVARELDNANNALGQPGRIILIGCGPGAGDLITLRAQQALQRADVLVIDRLVPNEIVEHARREAKRIYVGKTPYTSKIGGGASAAQEDINAILVREGLSGHIVARLKGGDAFVFGRAAEEIVAVRAAGLEVEIIPGITAAHACAARIGLPLTLRNKIRQFTILTGATTGQINSVAVAHRPAPVNPVSVAHDPAPVAHDPAPVAHDLALVAHDSAFAIYMGVESAPLIQSRLLATRADPDMPVVIVENGTLATERAFATVLRDLDACVASEQIKAPAILFFGLDWQSAGLTRPTHVKEFTKPVVAAEPAWSKAAVAEATHWVMG